MALFVAMLIAGVIYTLMYVNSWANLGAALPDFDTLQALMAGPLFVALLCVQLPRVLKCRPPDASKRIETYKPPQFPLLILWTGHSAASTTLQNRGHLSRWASKRARPKRELCPLAALFLEHTRFPVPEDEQVH